MYILILYDSIYLQCKNRQKPSVVMENRSCSKGSGFTEEDVKEFLGLGNGNVLFDWGVGSMGEHRSQNPSEM